MKNSLKILIYIMLLSISTVACGGVKSMEDIKKENLKYLEEKYGEEFEEKYGEGSNYEEMGFYKKGTNPETDVARLFRKVENGKLVMKDNYYGILVREEYEGIVSKEVEKVFGTNKVYMNGGFYGSWFPDNFKKEIKYYDALKQKEIIGSVVIYIENQDNNKISKEKVEKMNELLREKQIDGGYLIVLMKDNHLKNLTRENHWDYTADDVYGTYEKVVYDSISQRL